MIASRCLLAFIFLFFIAGCSDHRNELSEYEIRSVTVNGKPFDYRVFVPQNRDPNLKLPVMLYLHGSGTRGDDNFQQADAFSKTIKPVKDKIEFIVVLPQCRENTFWSSTEMADYARSALDSAIVDFNGDPERVYLAGFSLGGYGVWHIAAANPGKFAALVPIAGGVIGERPIEPRDRSIMIPEVLAMLDSPDPYRAIADAIGKTPVWVVHGAKDDAVPVEFSRRIVRAFGEAGNNNVKYTEYPDEGHIIVGKAFEEPGFFEWLSAKTLNHTR